jgi:subtilisin family serine protease
MRRCNDLVRAAIAIVTLVACVAWPAAAVERAYAPGRLYIKLRLDPAAAAQRPALAGVLGDALAHARPLVRVRAAAGAPAPDLARLVAVELPQATDVVALAAKLSRLPEVEYAEPAWIYELADAPPAARPAAVPTDPAYTGGQQAYLAALQVAAAWDVQTSGAAVPRPIVCIVDGGTNWQHEDLNANLWTNPGEIPGNGIDDDDNGYLDDVHGWNFRDDIGDPRGNPATPGNANHGTHTAGLAAAVTNNGVGMASASWNPLLMAVNASGNGESSIAWGYEGIVYAAENGADVVSLSWGSSGGSAALQDVVDFATAAGTLVVGAAGNGNTSNRFYPAAYDNVIAVANVFNNDQRYSGPSGSNYGGWLDVAAPGAGVYSTFDMGATNAYGVSTGTSMSCPVAAGVAALIKARHPTWGPLEVGEQLRMTCDDIDAVNPGYVDRLGRGRVNALRAVTETPPAVRVTSWTLADANADGQLNQGESVVVTLVVHNYLSAVDPPLYTLSTTSPWITLDDANEAGGALADDATATLTNAFAFTIAAGAPPGTRTELRLDIAATGYADYQFLPIVLEPVFETHDINRLTLSLTATGGLGFVGFASGLGDEGVGLAFDAGPNVLFEGALLLGTSVTALSDAARIGSEHTDFACATAPPPVKLTPGLQAAQEIHAAFTDSINTTTPLGVGVEMTSWASATPPHDDFVVVAYEIHNRTGAAFDSLWTALFFDWDIDETHFATNRTAYDAGRRLAYAWDDTPGLPWVGVMSLAGATAGFSAIPNNGGGPWALVDGFSKAEKWDVLEGGTGFTAAGPADISNALTSGPYAVAPGQSATSIFALLAAPDLAALQAAADRCVQWFADSVATDTTTTPPVPRPAAWLGPAVPNPFNPTTRFELDVRAHRHVEVAVFDARGRRLATLLDAARAPGVTSVTWNGTDGRGRRVASGVYIVRLQSGDVVQTRRVVLTK